jgi:hypothetical protein
VKSRTIETTFPATTDPKLNEGRCPNGHDSSMLPRHPALLFVARGHYPTEATWNEFRITCGVRYVPFGIYWRVYSSTSYVDTAEQDGDWGAVSLTKDHSTSVRLQPGTAAGFATLGG